jgi:glycosyltransferase involved in cell wall biosynthesis
MKVVVAGPYADGTGYAKACIENIMALDSVGVEVVPRSVKMTNTSGEVPERIKELEKNDLLNVDVVFNYNLPSEFIYKGGVKNVGSFAYETSGFPNTNWMHHIELMDKIIVPCNHQKAVLLTQNLDLHVDVIPHCVDTAKFSKKYKTFAFDLPKNTIKFYTIAEFGRRKNIPALLLAYYSAFTSDDNVVLVIKTHMPNRNGASTLSAVKNIIDDLKHGMGRFTNQDRYPKVIIQTEYMTDDEINSLHKSCDIFVTASHGEAWCLPAIDALGFGNPVIAPKHGAFKDYIYQNGGVLVDGVESPVFGVDGGPAGLYTADEDWFNVTINSLANAMVRVAIDKNVWLSDENRNKRSRDACLHYSRENVGACLKIALEK